MKISGIYKIQSICNPDRIYVGSGYNINKRWHEHVAKLRNNKHENAKLQNHYNKYGESDLQFSILAECEISKLLKNEQLFIESLIPFFNISKFAGSPMLGMKHSLETKYKMSIAGKGRIMSAEHKNKISKANAGKLKSENHRLNMKKPHGPMSAEHKLKIGESNKGYVATIETRKKISELHKGVKRGNYKTKLFIQPLI